MTSAKVIKPKICRPWPTDLWAGYAPGLCQWNLNSGSQSLLRFRIPWAVFRISKRRIPDFTGKIFPDFGFHYSKTFRYSWSNKQKIAGVWNPDSLSWDEMHIVNSYVDQLSTEIEKYCLCSINCPHAYGVVHNMLIVWCLGDRGPSLVTSSTRWSEYMKPFFTWRHGGHIGFQDNETAAMSVSQTNLVGVEYLLM